MSIGTGFQKPIEYSLRAASNSPACAAERRLQQQRGDGAVGIALQRVIGILQGGIEISLAERELRPSASRAGS